MSATILSYLIFKLSNLISSTHCRPRADHTICFPTWATSAHSIPTLTRTRHTPIHSILPQDSPDILELSQPVRRPLKLWDTGIFRKTAFSVDFWFMAISIGLGIFFGLLASFIQSLGLTIQRKSHVLNQNLPESQQRLEYKRPWLSPSFHSSFYLLILLSLVCGCLALLYSFHLMLSDLSFKSPLFPLLSSPLSERSRCCGMLSSLEFYWETFFQYGWF